MKIDEKLKVSGLYNPLAKEEKVKGAPGSSEFGRQLKELGFSEAYSYLKDSLSKIEAQGRKLSETLNISDLRYYRKMVSDFLYEAVNIMCVFEKESTTDRRGRLRKYAIVKKANEKVEELVRYFIDSEKNRIEILKMLDDIRGLLIDLLM